MGKDQVEPLIYIWGYDAKEKKRVDKIQEYFPEYIHEFPLIQEGLSKHSVHGLFKKCLILRGQRCTN